MGFDMQGKYYHFEGMQLRDVTVTHDGKRLLCVGARVASVDGLQPSRSQPEKQIIGILQLPLPYRRGTNFTLFSV